jgi:hypothetical protein
MTRVKLRCGQEPVDRLAISVRGLTARANAKPAQFRESDGRTSAALEEADRRHKRVEPVRLPAELQPELAFEGKGRPRSCGGGARATA